MNVLFFKVLKLHFMKKKHKQIVFIALFLPILVNAQLATWTEIGPVGLENFGRTHTVTFDNPQNPSILFACSPVGGLWYSNSTPLGDLWQNGGTDFLPAATASYCVTDPNNNTTWFLATGDGECADPNCDKW